MTTHPPETRATGLIAFLVLAFGFAWTGMVGASLLGLSTADPRVQLPFAFAPAVAAFVVRRWVTREGFGDAGLALRLRTAWPHYLVAWLGPAVLVVATAGVAAASGLWHPDLTPLDGQVDGLPGWALVAALLLAVPLLTPLYWGEEFGWTAYLRQRVFRGQPLAATIATGLIWAVWHYPLAFTGYVEFENVPIGLAAWTFSFVCQEILLSSLRVRSGTVWTASLAHAGNNMVLFLLTGALLGGDGTGLGVTATTLLTTVPLALLGLWVVATGRLDRPEPAVDR